MIIYRSGFPIFVFLLIISLAGCGSGSGGGSGGPTTGTLNLGLTDASVDEADNVTVEFTGVVIQPSSGDRLDFDFFPARTIDLLALNNGGSEIILDGVTVPAGHYDWIRLKVNADCNTLDSYITINKVDNSLSIPSGSQNGLKLVSGFDVPAGGVANFTIDFDLRKSVNYSPGQGNCKDDYKLKPALRLVNNAGVGSIAGTVAAILLSNQSCTTGNAVYVFTGHGIVPDDIDDIYPDPVTSAMVDENLLTYRAAFLSAGSYTVAFTCQAGDDHPEVDESLTMNPIIFSGAANVVVSSGTETIHNF